MATLALTQAGTRRAEDTRSTHGPDYAILSYMHEAGKPVEFDEIVSHLNTDEMKASMFVRRLMSLGLIKEV